MNSTGSWKEFSKYLANNGFRAGQGKERQPNVPVPPHEEIVDFLDLIRIV
jgi:hypothetical protein